jgi:hypothetical protein
VSDKGAWVSVGERLPEESDFYLVTATFDGETYTDKAYYYDSLEEWGNGPSHSCITHWQPMPPPTGEPQP